MQPSVLHVITGLGIGGAETSLLQIAVALQARGIAQHVVSLGKLDDHAAALRAGGVDVTVLGIDSIMRMPAGILRTARLIRQHKVSVVQGWMYHGNLAAAIAHRLMPGRAARRLYWNLRASNVDNERYAGLVRLSALLSRWPDLIVANSHAGARFHREAGFTPRRMDVIGNGVDTQRFKPDAQARAELRAELGIAPDAVVAIHAARVDPMKDHRGLLAAFAAVPGLQGVLVGAGTKKLDLPPNVKALGLRRNMTRLYGVADIVVSSSAFAEGFPNVIAEGMSAGLLPITTDVGDAGDIVGDTGQVVAPRDVAALTAALAAAAALSPADLQAAGLRARARIVTHFPLSGAIDAYARLYEPALDRAP